MAGETSLVQRLIAFLRKPEALEYDEREPVQNPYDDYEPQDEHHDRAPAPAPVEDQPQRELTVDPLVERRDHVPGQASRLDAMLMRAVQQFGAQLAFVLRYDSRAERMHYCTGRDLQGQFVSHTEADPDRRAVFLVLDSGESQLFVHHDDNGPVAILCGPLWVDNEMVGLLYLNNPARNRLHRGVFEVFCEQAARMLAEGV
jgi:hypothetical protein